MNLTAFSLQVLMLSMLLLIIGSHAYEEQSNCQDDGSFRQNNVEEYSCSWIRGLESRRLKSCREDSEVRKSCRLTCGECCEDDSSYEFHTFRDTLKDCRWLKKKQKRIKRYCDLHLSGMMVKSACPFACGQCKSPWDDDTQYSDACIDNEYFRYGDRAFKSCEWIGRQSGRRDTACANNEVLKNCPRSCRDCCKDDGDFLILTDNKKERGCGWLEGYTLRKRKYCSTINRGVLVENRCPVSCGICVA